MLAFRIFALLIVGAACNDDCFARHDACIDQVHPVGLLQRRPARDRATASEDVATSFMQRRQGSARKLETGFEDNETSRVDVQFFGMFHSGSNLAVRSVNENIVGSDGADFDKVAHVGWQGHTRMWKHMPLESLLEYPHRARAMLDGAYAILMVRSPFRQVHAWKSLSYSLTCSDFVRGPCTLKDKEMEKLLGDNITRAYTNPWQMWNAWNRAHSQSDFVDKLGLRSIGAVSYEELVRSPEKEMQKLSSMLGMKLKSNFAVIEDNAAAATVGDRSSALRNIGTPIRSLFSDADVEFACGELEQELLERFGYAEECSKTASLARQAATTTISDTKLASLQQVKSNIGFEAIADKERVSRLEASVIVAGVARDTAGHVASVVPWMQQLRDIFSRGEIVIYESGSSDDTLARLREALANDPHGHVLTGGPEPGSSRSMRIANARNTLLRDVLARSADYLIVLDLDLGAEPQHDSIRHAIQTADQWDAVSFRTDPYWDIWALRSSDFCPHNCWGRNGGQEYVERMRKVMASKLDDLPDDAYLPVDSAFMLLSIYKMSHVSNCSYDGEFNHQMDCEHVAFHHCMIEKHQARIRVSPRHL